jgi:hypothetical protein
MERNPSPSDQHDRQLRRLAGQLRDTGTSPERDLWPDINTAIDRQEDVRSRENRHRGRNWLRMTAVAAALVLMLAAGWAGIRSITDQFDATDVVLAPEALPSGMDVIDKALDELTLALADDPENKNLSQLVLMVHKTRGNLLRRTSDKLLRD